MNKIKYGLKNMKYAPVTNTEGVITYGTPVAIPGGVSISLSPKGEKTDFFADDTLYFSASSNQGYDGTLEVALLPDQFKKDILGWKEDENGALFEDSNATGKNFALLFEFLGDAKATRHVLYNVSATKPNVESTTKGNSIEVKTDSIAITAAPALDTGYVKAKMEHGSTAYDNWYTAVYEFVPVVGG